MENKNRDFKGIWIPKDIYLSKELSWTDKLIFIEINSLDNESHCVASNAYFSDFLGISERSVSRSISKLIQLGYVKVINFDGKQRALTTMSTQTRQECLGSIDTNVYHNNIVNNTVNNNPYNPQGDKEYTEDFLDFWHFYPKQRAGSKEKAFKAYVKALKEKRTTKEQLHAAVKRYAFSDEVLRGFAKGCAAWLNDDRFNTTYTQERENKWKEF